MTLTFEESLRLRLGPVEQIPLGEGRIFEIGGEAVAVFRCRNGKVHATQAFCPHKGGLLADGLTGEGKVICPLHAYKFDLESGEPLGNNCPPLRIYPVEVKDDGSLGLRREALLAETERL